MGILAVLRLGFWGLAFLHVCALRMRLPGLVVCWLGPSSPKTARISLRPRDDDKGKWVLHAEQNVFMFRCIDDASACELYSTHSPCVQCSGIVRSMGYREGGLPTACRSRARQTSCLYG